MSMEHVLHKLAKQLNAYDEASLMALWEQYAAKVENFEPTKQWEEAALVFGIIQSVRWKNQLFNYHWAENSRPAHKGGLPPQSSFTLLEDVPSPGGLETEGSKLDNGPAGGDCPKKRAKVLSFPARERD